MIYLKQIKHTAELRKIFPGILLCTGTAAAGLAASGFAPGIGGVTLALVLGIAVGNIFSRSEIYRRYAAQGINFAEKRLLPFTIALLGAELHIGSLKSLGPGTILMVLVMIAVTIFSGIVFGRLLGMSRKCSILLGCGNAICGSSAIASVTKVIDGSAEDTGLAVTAVNFMGTIGIFILPLIAGIAGFGDIETAEIIGGVLQAVGQVVASGYYVNEHVGQIAVLVKMCRVLMLGPVVIVLGIIFRKEKDAGGRQPKISIPLFIAGFFLMSLLASFDIISGSMLAGLNSVSGFLLAVAMAGIGMRINIGIFRKQGLRAVLAECLIMTVQITAACIMAVLIN